MDAKTNLEQQYANRNIEAIWRMESAKLNAPALRSVNIMKRLFPRDRIFGMDIGIDHKGRLWLIEANRFPAMSHFRKLGNKKIIRRIMNFKNSRA